MNSRLSPEKKGLLIPEANISCQDLKPDQVIGILGHPELSFWVTLHYRLQSGRKFKRGESSLKNLSIKGSTGLFFGF